MTQSDLFNLSLREKFERYHAENPHIYHLFLKYTAEARAAGMTRYSANAIFERIRWHLNIEKPKDDTFKMNNNYRAFYARKLMEERTEFAGFFETREQKSA